MDYQEAIYFFSRIRDSGLFYATDGYGYVLKGTPWALVTDSYYNVKIEHIFSSKHITIEELLENLPYEKQLEILFNLEIFSRIK